MGQMLVLSTSMQAKASSPPRSMSVYPQFTKIFRAALLLEARPSLLSKRASGQEV